MEEKTIPAEPAQTKETPAVLSEHGVKILLNEYNLCNDRINSFQNRQDTILQISMAILGGAIAFTLLNDIAEEFFIIIPLIPIILFTHIMYHYTRNIANQGYREYLQSKLNGYLAEGVEVKYTSVVKAFLLNTNPMAKVNGVIFPSLILLSMAYSVFMSKYNVLVVLGNLLIFIFVVIIGVSFARFSIDLNEKVKDYCEEC